MLRWRNFFLDIVGARVPNKLVMIFVWRVQILCYTTFRSNKIRDYCLVPLFCIPNRSKGCAVLIEEYFESLNKLVIIRLHPLTKSIGDFRRSISKTYEKKFFSDISIVCMYYVSCNNFYTVLK